MRAPYLDDGDITVYHGDCVAVMREMPAGSVDAIVCDPPYGLEFMGKEWDRLDGGLPQEAVWKGRRGRGGSAIGDDDSKPGSRHRVALGGQRARLARCRICGRRQFSGSPCECPEPSWTYETPEGPPSGMVRMQRWHEAWAREALRVLKPGGHLLAFGGTRTYHRMACAIEDAGFEIRDSLHWLYGSGFPKSLDVSKAIDREAGAEREVVGARIYADGHVQQSSPDKLAPPIGTFVRAQDDRLITAPATPEAAAWQGWGTALKPAHEPIVVARKPLAERTVARQVLATGTGALNVDGCRLQRNPDDVSGWSQSGSRASDNRAMSGPNTEREARPDSAGRWPPNLLLAHDAACEEGGGSGGPNGCAPGCPVGKLDRQAPSVGGGDGGTPATSGYEGGPRQPGKGHADTGGASRFFPTFRYEAKASGGDRGEGNSHPTVKPLALMRWLCRLVTPPGGLVLDPFAGSGTTLLAARHEGFNAIGIEMTEEYLPIIASRLRQLSLFAEADG